MACDDHDTPPGPRSPTSVHANDSTPLDPEIARFVREMRAAWARSPDLSAAPPREMRRIAEQVRAPWARGGPEMAAVVEHRIPVPHAAPVRVRQYTPVARTPLPGFVYLHGGGWTLFSIDTHDRLMREYAAGANVSVVGVDYSLAPESKYPVALEQVCSVVRHLHEDGSTIGIDPHAIGIGGDSAGGNLALSACLRLRDDDGKSSALRALVLNYAVLVRRSSAEAIERFGGPGNMLTSDEMETFWANYLDDDRQAADPLVSPGLADLHGVPPTCVVVPECDLLAEQSLALAERLRDAGVAVSLRTYPGASHSFLEAVSIARVAQRALAETCEWLRNALGAARR